MKYYYSNEYCDYVCDLESFKIMLKEDDLEEMELEEQRRDYGGEMWCRKKEDFVEKGVDCGGFCHYYNPCNGKSGRCRYLKNGFIGTGKKFILTKSGKMNNVP